jgi:hypothetical protein
MPRTFNRILTFHVQGEIYDNHTQAEDIIRNYNFNFKDYNDGVDRAYLIMDHKDHRGRITKMARLPKIHRWKKPDTELFLNL